MEVQINSEPKLSKLDHLFVLVAEGDKPRPWRKAIDESGFAGRGDEAITVLNKEPKKLTLVGLGKQDKLSIRGLRAALYSVAKTAKKHRDRAIGVAVSYTLASLTAEETTRVTADYLGQADYKYDAYITANKDEKAPPITATLIPPGGITIKPAEKMEEMKFDMCGAAAVIGTIEAAAGLELPVRITGVIPSTDNLPSGSAYKPGDIITTMSGKTVEIVNTDAEGRMILADALHYASQLKPDHLLDFATLTGACVVALANEAAGLFYNDD